MPPQRTRDRGRGRGGAGAAAARKQSQAEDEQMSTSEPAASTPPAEHPPTLSTSAYVARQQEDGSPDPIPSFSPASMPTETPAPTPAKTPVQRLESLGISDRGAFGIGRGRGFGGRVMSTKFKPKTVQRRAADEREKAERDEQARLREREENAQRQQGRGAVSAERRSDSRGNWMRGRARGRGEAMGSGRLDRNAKMIREASGLFGIAPAAGVKKPGRFLSGNTSGTGAGGGKGHGNSKGGVTITRSATDADASGTSRTPGIKQESDITVPSMGGGINETDSDTSTPVIKVEFPEPVYPEDQEEGVTPIPKVNIECINLLTDDEDDDFDMVASVKKKGKGRVISRGAEMKPVRVERQDHKDRVTLVNTEPAAATLIEDSKEFSLQTDEDMEDPLVNSLCAPNKITWSGAWRDEVEIKSDPDQAGDVVDVDSNQGAITQSSDVEPVEEVANEELNTYSVSRNEKEKPTSLPKRTGKKKTPVLQTQEDREEYERHLEDVRILTEELLGGQRPHSTISLGPDDACDIDEEPRRDKNGRLYLFQFPPILPPLRSHVKREEDFDPTDMPMPDIDTDPGSPIDLTEESLLLKPDPDPRAHLPQAPSLLTEQGYIGKLIVRQSGKIELDWGGTRLQLGRGAESEFLTTTLIADPPGEAIMDDIMGVKFRRGAEKPEGMGYGLGRVMGKFVVTPDWGGVEDME